MTDKIEATNNYRGISYNTLNDLSHGLKKFMEYKELSDYDINKELEGKILTLLRDLGYPTSTIGLYYYKDLIVKACNLKLNGISDERLYKLLEYPYSQFYFDIARNEHDIGIKNFNSIVYSCLNNRKKSKCTDKLAIKVMKKLPEESNLGDCIFLISSYICDKKEKVAKNTKIYIKQKDFK